MRQSESTRTYAADELKTMRRRGEDRTDWAKVDAMIEADLEPDWTRAELVMPRPRQSVHLRLDPEVVDFFKAGGKGHITRMQAVLRAYVDAQKRRHEATRDASIARSRCRAQRDLATARRRSTRDAGRRIHEALHG